MLNWGFQLLNHFQRPRIISLGPLTHEFEGNLRVIEPEKVFGFLARRTYWIEGVPEKAVRGHHAHKNLYQAIVLLRGEAMVNLVTPEARQQFHLKKSDEALIIPPGFWREMREFSSDALMLVYASAPYDEHDYIRDWESYVDFYQTP